MRAAFASSGQRRASCLFITVGPAAVFGRPDCAGGDFGWAAGCTEFRGSMLDVFLRVDPARKKDPLIREHRGDGDDSDDHD